jgi:hypothetical protein
MTTPITIPSPAPTTLAEFQSLVLEPTINPAVTAAQDAIELAPPGAVQSGIDFDALGTALLDFGQVAGDVGNVFAQDFFDVITEGLAVAQLVVSIIGLAEQGASDS